MICDQPPLGKPYFHAATESHNTHFSLLLFVVSVYVNDEPIANVIRL